MSKRQQALRFNQVAAPVRDEHRDGTAFLAVPVAMLREQVLFCSNCHPDGEFVSAAEIVSTVEAWNNRPVTLSHPTAEWTPSNHQRLEVGRIFNAFWDGKLKAEMWLDLQALRRTSEGKAIEANFRDGKIQEISTGYFVDRIERTGKFQGQTFAIVQMNIVPDHLAILTGEVGACSVAGGCGAPRLNSSEGDSMDDETKLSRGFKRLLQILGRGDESTDGDGGDGGDGTAGNSGGSSSASATGDNGQDGGSGAGDSDGSGSAMKEKEKAALVKRLLASKKVETFDEKALLAMSDEQLTSLATLASCGCADGDGEGGDAGKGDGSSANAGKGDGDGEGKKKPAANAEGKKEPEGGDGEGKKEPAANAAPTISPEDQKFLTLLREAGGDSVDGLVALMEAGKVEATRRKTLKDDLVKQLNKDEKVAMSEAVLNSMSLEALEGLDRSLNPTNYAGRGGARIENRGGDDEHFAPDAPAILLADPDGTKSGDGDGTGGDS